VRIRDQFWIDNCVQGALVIRVFIYAGCVALYAVFSNLVFMTYDQPQATLLENLTSLFAQNWMWMPGIVLLLPLIAFDVVKLSHQFAGPIYHLRKHLSDFFEDEEKVCRPLRFRTGDFWHDLAEAINEYQKYVQSLQEQVKEQKLLIERLTAENLMSSVELPEGLMPELPEAVSTEILEQWRFEEETPTTEEALSEPADELTMEDQEEGSLESVWSV
jgi:hypothetical protein